MKNHNTINDNISFHFMNIMLKVNLQNLIATDSFYIEALKIAIQMINSKYKVLEI